jgi:hypothetical protein
VQARHPSRVDVARDDDRVRSLLEHRPHPISLLWVPVPLVRVEDRAEGQRAEHHRLADDVPHHVGSTQARLEPGLLLGAQEGAILTEALGAVGQTAAARGWVTVLTSVEHVEGGQIAPAEVAVDLQARSGRSAEADRQVFEPGAVGGRLPRVVHHRVVVVELVVVPDGDDGRGMVGRLQVGVRLVQGVPIAVLRQRDALVWSV